MAKNIGLGKRRTSQAYMAGVWFRYGFEDYHAGVWREAPPGEQLKYERGRQFAAHFPQLPWRSVKVGNMITQPALDAYRRLRRSGDLI